MDKKVIFEVIIEKDKCKGCQLCVYYCPVKHLKLADKLNKKGRNFAEAGETAVCTGCGICFAMCPDAAVKITREEGCQTKDEKKEY